MRQSISAHDTSGAGHQHARTAEVVSALTNSGLVDPQRAGEARAVVDAVLSGRAAGAAPLRRRLAEVAGYVGGALVVAAAAIFLSEQWESLSTTGRVATLAVITLVLFGAAVAVVRTGQVASAETDGDVRRRLASALTCGAAVASGFCVGVLVDAQMRSFSEAPLLAGSLAVVVVAVGGYLLAPSALGQLTSAVAAYAVVYVGLEVFDRESGLVVGLLVVALGLGWLMLAERRAWRERYVGLATGCALVLLGAQTPVIEGGSAWAGYLMTASAAAVAVVIYTRGRAVPYLVAAVVGITLVVPEALLDWSDGSLGPVGVLLVTGVTLLGASMLGLRLRHEVGTPGRPGITG
jgi:small-conductance mechanosensitive channel